MTLTSFLTANPLSLDSKITNSCLLIACIQVVWELRCTHPKTRFLIDSDSSELLRFKILEALGPIKPIESIEINPMLIQNATPKYAACMRPHAKSINLPHIYLKKFLDNKVFSKSIINRAIQLISEFSLLCENNKHQPHTIALALCLASHDFEHYNRHSRKQLFQRKPMSYFIINSYKTQKVLLKTLQKCKFKNITDRHNWLSQAGKC